MSGFDKVAANAAPKIKPLDSTPNRWLNSKFFDT
jgi:hypothetical protein